MGSALESITIRGFKSIEALEDFEPGDLSLLIGANGSGKSNFVDFFRLLRAMADEGLQRFINSQGGADGFFFLGPQHTRQIHARLEFGQNVYEFDLEPTAGGDLQVADERVMYTGGHGLDTLTSIGKGNRETRLHKKMNDPGSFGHGKGVPSYVYRAVSEWTVYHFHDTSMLAPMRRDQPARDRAELRQDASNIASFLYELGDSSPNSYSLIRDTVRLVIPFFDDFLLEQEEKGGEEKIRLEWRQQGTSFPFQPVHLSDGSIRFICLATALLQPYPPSTIVIDEPELGLHPFAIGVLADLIQSAAQRTQVVIATQSTTLIDHFTPEQIVVVNRRDGNSSFERLERKELADWLEDYSIGELWQKNVVKAGPNRE